MRKNRLVVLVQMHPSLGLVFGLENKDAVPEQRAIDTAIDQPELLLVEAKRELFHRVGVDEGLPRDLRWKAAVLRNDVDLDLGAHATYSGGLDPHELVPADTTSLRTPAPVGWQFRAQEWLKMQL